MVVTAFLLPPSNGEVRAVPLSQWSQDYDCDEAFWTNNHAVRNGADDWADGTHEYIPGDCSVHLDQPD